MTFLLSSGRKEDGEGGIMFDYEDEKEQWEEDQKVNGAVIPNICLIETLNSFLVASIYFFNLLLSHYFVAS